MSGKTGGYLRTGFWRDPDLRGRSDSARLLAAYYITGEHTTYIGCFRCPVSYVAYDMGWDDKRVIEIDAELARAAGDEAPPFSSRDGEWVFVWNFLRHNALVIPTWQRGAAKLFEQVPKKFAHRAALLEALLAQDLPEETRQQLLHPEDQRRVKRAGRKGARAGSASGGATPIDSVGDTATRVGAVGVDGPGAGGPRAEVAGGGAAPVPGDRDPEVGAGEPAGLQGEGPEEPANERVLELADSGIAAPRFPGPERSKEHHGSAQGRSEEWGHGGSSPPPLTAPPQAVAGGLPAPQALARFAARAGGRWAPGKAYPTATGLSFGNESAWLRAWTEAREAGYTGEDLDTLGDALAQGRIWKGKPLSPGKLAQHLSDLLAEATAPVTATATQEGTRNRPSWKEKP